MKELHEVDEQVYARGTFIQRQIGIMTDHSFSYRINDATPEELQIM